ncbi:MAG: twin-arginine translocation signal domain-containing protein, partial [Planctomycetota bacterium]|nr:twin-arginine translocation signal domain-containing protein [Planctomycetota bacterium]
MSEISRRQFVKTTVSATAAFSVPAIVTANKSGSRLWVGNDDHAFEIQHDWPQLPERFSWQTTHNV